MEAQTGRPGQRKKKIPEVVAYAVGHRIRVQILVVLNEGTYTSAQIAHLIGESPNNVGNHVRELVDGGSIELAKEEQKGNVVRHYYRAVEIPYYSQEEAEAMTFEERQVTAGLVVQSGSAEVMAALWKGKLADPRAVLAWDWYNVDQEGRADLETENRRYLERVREIEVESTNRRADSGEDATSMLVSLSTFERSRQGHKFPPT